MDERERACDEAVLQSGTEAQLYAESILNVCKFCVESPLACASGVSGSDLKKRIVRIMTNQIARKLDFSRKLLLSMVGIAVLTLPVVLGLAHVVQVHAQATAENPVKDIAGTWQGTLHAPEGLQIALGRDLRVVVKISKADDGEYKALCYDIDHSWDPIPAYKVTIEGTTVKISVPFVRATYEGELAADGRTIAGNATSNGGVALPLNLTRATTETEWTIPPPPPRLPPMDPNATPSFEITTIKPVKSDQPGGISLQGNRLRFTNITLNDLITFAYEVHLKQAIGSPPWAGTDKFDTEIKPEGEGVPSGKQWKGMLQKLMADRFKLVFHREMKELPVYALSVGKTGPKLAKGDQNGVPYLHFGVLGNLHAVNATMADFTQMMQTLVLDRPVVDQTGLEGRLDFDLNWTPDDSQFAGLRAQIHPPADGADALPPLYTAIQEQIGLKLDATMAPVEVLVIDHVEKPSEK
jgi:uncharacterized protein (TIGR03435 family)